MWLTRKDASWRHWQLGFERQRTIFFPHAKETQPEDLTKIMARISFDEYSSLVKNYQRTLQTWHR
jgi:hypothetical protein